MAYANGSYTGSSYETDGENMDVFQDNNSEYGDGYDSEYLESAPVQLITLEQVHELARNISKHFIDPSNVAKTLTAEQREELKWNIIEALEQLDRVVKAHDSLQRENEAVQDEIRQRVRDTQKLQDACKTLQKFLEECEDTEERMKEELRAMVAECSKERQENERLRHLLEEESGNLVNDNNGHDVSLDENAVINFEQTISQLKEMNKALRQQLALRETELETERDKVDELESFIDEVEHVCVSLKTKVEKLETEVNELEGEREQLSAESENQRLKIDHLGKMLEASKKLSVTRSISVESIRNQKTVFDELNAMQTVMETEYDSDGGGQDQNNFSKPNEIFGDQTLGNQHSQESLSQVEASYAEVIQEFQKFSDLQHVCMELADEFVAPEINHKTVENSQLLQQEMKYKINDAFDVLSSQLQPMVYAEDVKEKFASFLEIQKSNPSLEAKQQVLSVVTRFIKNSSHSVFEESFPILAISLMETAKWDNHDNQQQNEEPTPDHTTTTAEESESASNITAVEIHNTKQMQTTAKAETVEVENDEIFPTQVKLRSSEVFLPNFDKTNTTNSDIGTDRLAELQAGDINTCDVNEPSSVFGAESRTDQLAESQTRAEVSEHKESIEDLDHHHESKTERSETMKSETSGEESRLNERVPSTREGSIYINPLPTPTNNPSQPNYPNTMPKSDQILMPKTTVEMGTQTTEEMSKSDVPDIVEPPERPGGKVKLGRRQTIWTSDVSKSGYRPRSPRLSMRRGVAGGWRSGRAMSITSGGPEAPVEQTSPMPAVKPMLAHQSTIDLLGQSDSNKDERMKWYKEQKMEPSKMLKVELISVGGVNNKGMVDVSKVMERMSDQNKQPMYSPDGRYLLIDPLDPDRPRYTKTELMQVIEEKASLCIDKMNLQEELNNVRRELEDLRKATVTMTQRWFEDSNSMRRNQQQTKPSAIRRLFGIFSGRPNSFSRTRNNNRGPRGEFIPSRQPNEPRRRSHPTVLETDSNSTPLMIHELPLTMFNSDSHSPRGRSTTCEQNPTINSTREQHNQSPSSRYSPFLYKRFSAKYAQKDKSVTLNYPSSKSRNEGTANQSNFDRSDLSGSPAPN